MRIGKKTHVEHQVGIRGNAVVIAKADDRNEHRALVGILEALGDEVAQFVNVELRGVDDHVGELADGLHQERVRDADFRGRKNPCPADAGGASRCSGAAERLRWLR